MEALTCKVLLHLLFYFCPSLLLILLNNFELQGFHSNGSSHSAELKILFNINTEGQDKQH